MITDRSEYEERLRSLRARLVEADCDAALLTNPASLRYLTGFTGTSAFFVVTPSREHLIVDFRYTEQAAAQCPCPVTRREGALNRELRSWLDGAARCALESQHVTIDLLDQLRAAASTDRTEGSGPIQGTTWVPIPDLVEQIRIRKDTREVERLRSACALLEKLMTEVLEGLRPGLREIDVALEFEMKARKETCRPLPFEPIIASGERAALPHGVASAKTIDAGDLVVVDLGLELDGYVADMTRTVAVRHADERMREVHEAVHLANRTAAHGIRAGMTGAEAHALAAGVLEARGLGDRFGHGLGHGLGVEIHEEPRLSPLGNKALAEGMVFTIEPGVYIPGWGGVRIEDAGVLTENGLEIFNRMERTLMVV